MQKQNILNLFNKPVTKLNIMYCILLAALYAGFWIGYYFLTVGWSLGLGIAITVIPLVFFIIYRKKTAVAIIFIIATGLGLGLCISAFFLHKELIPSKFFGLVILIFLGIKCLQAFICSIIAYKKLLIMGFVFVEILAVILLLANIEIFDAALKAQVIFALAISIFLSLGHIGFFSKEYSLNSWRNAAIGLLIGYIIIVIIIICLIAEDGPDGFDLSLDIDAKKPKPKKTNKR